MVLFRRPLAITRLWVNIGKYWNLLSVLAVEDSRGVL